MAEHSPVKLTNFASGTEVWEWQASDGSNTTVTTTLMRRAGITLTTFSSIQVYATTTPGACMPGYRCAPVSPSFSAPQKRQS